MDLFINNASHVDNIKYKVTTNDDPDGVSGSLKFWSLAKVTIDSSDGAGAKIVFSNSVSGKDTDVQAGDTPTGGIATYVEFDNGIDYIERAFWTTPAE